MKKINNIREYGPYIYMIDEDNDYIPIDFLTDIGQCPICLDNSGELIESGCNICKDNNKWIHRECLYELQKKHYHITRCYICKSPLENIPILYNHHNDQVIIDYNSIMDNRRESRLFYNNYHKNCFVIFIAITLLGIVGKILLYVFIEIIGSKPPDTLLVFNFSPMSIFLHYLIGSVIFIVRYYFYFNCCRRPNNQLTI